MSKNNDSNVLPTGVNTRRKPPTSGSLSFSSGSKSMEENRKNFGLGSKTSLSTFKWHSAPTSERDDVAGAADAVLPPPPPPTIYKSTATIEVAAGGAAGSGVAAGWKPLQRQKVVTAAPTLEEDEYGRAVVPGGPGADNEHDGGGGSSGTERLRKRSVTVRRGYSCQESCAARRQLVQSVNNCGCGTAQTMVGLSTATENRRRWLSADTGTGQAAGNSRSMECLPSPQPSSAHHRTSFIMAADDRKSLDSGLDDVAAAAEMADRRRGMFASTRTSVPSHLSLALPSCERRLTILSPHTHAPSTPAPYSSSTESAWHFCTSSATATASASVSSSSSSSVMAACRNRKKSRPGMVLPRLVLPASSDLDIFSQ